MNKILYGVIFIVLMMLGGCANIANKPEGENDYEKRKLSFEGTWSVVYSESLDEELNDDTNNDIDYSKGKVILATDRVCIINEMKKNIRYKLKHVNKNYILSEQYDLSMERFLKEDQGVDVISIIDNNQIISEFFINDYGDMILLYKSMLFKLIKESDKTKIKNHEKDIIDVEKKNNKVTEGVMIGIKTPRIEQEDGTYSDEEYRTIWISHKDGDIGTIYEKENIIFPRMSGIFKLKVDEKDINGKKIDIFSVSTYDSAFKENDSIKEAQASEYKSIKFIGNDYIAIEKYIGDDFKGEYPIYQIMPVNNINSNEGIQINEIFNGDVKEKYIQDFKRATSNLAEDELKVLNTESITYCNFTMERSFGKWILVSKIPSKNNKEEGIDFKLSIAPNNKLINYNYLNISWKSLKSELGFFKDAYTSPKGEIALIQFNDYLAIYRIKDGILISSPIATIPINEDEEIIMAEWSEGSYVEQWAKFFYDGNVIADDYE